jgi:hypothetical protein
VLHSYATFVQKEVHSSHILTFRHHGDVTTISEEPVKNEWLDIFNLPDVDSSLSDENPYFKSYGKWKTEKIGTPQEENQIKNP